MAHFLLILLSLFMSRPVLASSCCGQSPASFTVLSLNQRLSLSTGFSHLRSQGRVFNNSDEFFTWDNKKREVRALALNVASVPADRQQVFVNASLLQGQYVDSEENQQATSWSDTLVGYTYELLPEYSFSYWKPVVFATAFLSLPTGRSIYNKGGLSEGTDVTGHDQWGAGLGVTLKKVYFPWTLTLQGRSIQLFAEDFGAVRVSRFYDSSLAFLVNYASRWQALQLNGGVTFTHLSPRTIAPGNVTSGETQNFSVLAGVQKPISDSWAAGVSYSDQTLLGPAKNSILNRSLSFNFNFNYY